MKYQLGEFVRFIDERREGYITKIINDDMVGVTGDDDFEIPVMVSNITRVHGHPSNAEFKELVHDVSEDKDFIERGIYLVAVPDANKGSVIHFYVVNESSYQVMLSLKTHSKNIYKGVFFDRLGAQAQAKVYSAALPDLDLWPTLNFQALFYSSSNREPKKPLSFNIKFGSKDFSGSKQKIKALNAQGWLFRMDEPELVIDAEKLKESFFKPVAEKPSVQKPAKEVDLHIDKLRDDYAFLNNKEILDIQLAHFQSNLEAAIVHKYDSMVFIHGVGNGILQQHIHKAASKNPQVETFMDAQKQKFGYGATVIFFK